MMVESPLEVERGSERESNQPATKNDHVRPVHLLGP